jgi:hypothetical protein
LQDIALPSGGKTVVERLGSQLKNVEISDLGEAKSRYRQEPYHD